MLPALIVGALTAWYLGLRAGVIAAIVTAIAMLIAQFVPGLTMLVYGLVIAWSLAVYFLGAKITDRIKGPGWFGVVTGQASAWVKKVMKSGEK
jgi:hypothetical protein